MQEPVHEDVKRQRNQGKEPPYTRHCVKVHFQLPLHPPLSHEDLGSGWRWGALPGA